MALTSDRRPSLRPRQPWLVLTAGLGAASLWLFARNAGTAVPSSWGASGGARSGAADWIDPFQQGLLSPLTLGTLILRRHPGHLIGRLLVALGCVAALAQFTQEWAVYGYYSMPGAAAGAGLAAWVTNWIWIVLFSLLLLTTALFPDGRFLSRRWGWFIGGLLALFALPILIAAMCEPRLSSAFQIANPFVSSFPEATYSTLFGISITFMPITAVAVLASAVLRYRASRARERQQMKWLLVGVALMAALTITGLGLNFGLGQKLGATLVNAAVLSPALGVGAALLRHQLYDIDVVIRRTLVYSLLTALLALTYFGLVIVLQGVVTALGGQRPEWVTVASTLAVAGLFAPLRARVQAFIDRRFYRTKYNAAQALAEFAAAARDETDLVALVGRLERVVDEALQPTQTSTWIQNARRSEGGPPPR